MIKKIAATAVAALTALPLVGVAEAGVPPLQGGQIRHLNDKGFDPPIVVRCRMASPERSRVPERTSSTRPCGTWTYGLIVRRGTDLWCRETGSGDPLRLNFTTTGFHELIWRDRYDCVVTRNVIAGE